MSSRCGLSLFIACSLSVLVHPRFDARREVEEAATDENASPEGQLSSIYGHSQNTEFSLED